MRIPRSIQIREYAEDPTLHQGAAPPLREQFVACGETPEVSAPFGPETKFVFLESTIPYEDRDRYLVFVEFGADPLPALIAKSRANTLPASPNARGKLVRSAEPGMRVAVFSRPS
jgi:hypothetical protein